MKIRQPNPKLALSRPLTLRNLTNRIILHHYDSDRATPQEVHRWHIDRGWEGIGYHFMIDLDGTVWQGRDMDSVGTHTANNNGDSIGIACQGRFHTTTREMPDVQFNSLVWLIIHIRQKYGNLTIIGHRDASPSACPGQFFPLEEIQRLQFRGDKMTQEQFNGMMREFLRTQDVQEVDNSLGKEAIEEFNRAVSRGITDGTRPQGFATRAMVAVMIERATNPRGNTGQ